MFSGWALKKFGEGLANRKWGPKKQKTLYYVFDLKSEESVSQDYEYIGKAEEILCALAGIGREDLKKYLAGNCRYEIRAYKI